MFKNQKLKVIVILAVFSLVAALLLAGFSVPQATTQSITVGIYDGNGTWDVGKTAIKNFLDAEGIDWILMSPFDVNSGKWNKFDQIDVFWVPGGWAGNYNFNIKNSGFDNIRGFVSDGGKMIGTCAGQYFIADRIVWEEEDLDYPLSMFQGVISGSLHDIIPWEGYTNTVINLDSSHPINAGFSSSLTMAYYGGGDIWPDAGQSVDWVGSYDVTSTEGIATFSYGSGTVLFMGPHPEVGLDGNNNWNTTGGASAQWDWLSSAIQWLINQ